MVVASLCVEAEVNMKVTRPTVIAMVLVLLVAPLAAEAQPAAKMPRLGYLESRSPSRVADQLEALRQGLSELGYVEGRNIVIEYRYAEGKFERLPDLAADLVRLKVDLIVAGTTRSVLAAKDATSTIPIVMLAVADPLGSGLIASLARPGGNITGLTFLGAELSAKRLELLKEVVPGLSRVAVLWHPGAHGERTQRDMLKETEVAGRALGLQLQFLEAREPSDFDGAFSAMTREHAGALLVLTSPMFSAEGARLADLAAKSRLPATYHLKVFAEAGGLMSYGARFTDQYRRAATFVDKILKGAKPGDLPVEQPTKFELVINLKTAKALGLKIPPSVLVRATEVIE
jgi:putative ABC transport system substrate-binding protein